MATNGEGTVTRGFIHNMIYDYIIDLTPCKIPEPLIIGAIRNVQERIDNGRLLGQLVNDDDDLAVDIMNITHMVSRLEYKHRRVRCTIKVLDIPKGRAINPFIKSGNLLPVIVGKGSMNAITGEMEEWRIKSVGYMTQVSFPVQFYADHLWNNGHFKEELFTL